MEKSGRPLIGAHATLTPDRRLWVFDQERRDRNGEDDHRAAAFPADPAALRRFRPATAGPGTRKFQLFMRFMNTMQREGVGIMAHTDAPTRGNISGLDQRPDMGTGHAIPIAVRRKVRISPFWRHFLEMFAAMMLGMMAGKPVFLAITGLSSTAQAGRLYPAQSVLSMGLSMTVPMVAWMLFRGHGWRNSAEMAAAMLVPAIPFIILCSLHVLTGGPANGAYMMLSTMAMIGLMVYRRGVYSTPMRWRWSRAAP
jgi:hypothetical protein